MADSIDMKSLLICDQEYCVRMTFMGEFNGNVNEWMNEMIENWKEDVEMFKMMGGWQWRITEECTQMKRF